MTKNVQTTQWGLIPSNNSKTKKVILSTHLIFAPNGHEPIVLTQKEVDKLSTMAVLSSANKLHLLKQKYEKKLTIYFGRAKQNWR